jgi:hypothetical protein
LIAHASSSYLLCEKLAGLPQGTVTPCELKQRIVEQMRDNEMSLEGGEDGGKVKAIWRENGEWFEGIASLEALGRRVGALRPSEHLAEKHAPAAMKGQLRANGEAPCR